MNIYKCDNCTQSVSLIDNDINDVNYYNNVLCNKCNKKYINYMINVLNTMSEIILLFFCFYFFIKNKYIIDYMVSLMMLYIICLFLLVYLYIKINNKNKYIFDIFIIIIMQLLFTSLILLFILYIYDFKFYNTFFIKISSKTYCIPYYNVDSVILILTGISFLTFIIKLILYFEIIKNKKYKNFHIRVSVFKTVLFLTIMIWARQC